MIMSKFANFFHYKEFDAEKSVTSWFISPKTLLIIRGIISLYTWVVLIGQLSFIIRDGIIDFLKFFTNLSFVGLTAYFTTAFYRSVIKNYGLTSSYNQSNILNWLFWLLYHTIVHFPMLLTLSFWIFLSDDEILKELSPFEWWINVSMHGINLLFSIIEISLNRQIMIFSFIILNGIILILYTFVVYINYAVTSYWIYGFLDYTQGMRSVLWYIGLLTGSTLIFLIMYGIHFLRDILGRRFGHYLN